MTPGSHEADTFGQQDTSFQSQHLLNALGLAQNGGGNPFRDFLAKQMSRYSLLADLLQMGQESAPSAADYMGRQLVAGFGGQPRTLANDLYQQAIQRLNQIASGGIDLGSGDNATSGAKQVAMLAAALNNRYSGSYRNIMYDRIQRSYNQFLHEQTVNPQGTESNFFAYAKRIGLLPGGTASTETPPATPPPVTTGPLPGSGGETYPGPTTGEGDPGYTPPPSPAPTPEYNPIGGWTPERTPAPAPPSDWTVGGTGDWAPGQTEEERQAELARRQGGWANSWARSRAA
jgi:hypothetical protein